MATTLPVRAYLYLNDPLQKLADRGKFRIELLSTDLLYNGWIRVTVVWNADSCHKYCDQVGTLSAYRRVAMDLKMQNVRKGQKEAFLTVGLCANLRQPKRYRDIEWMPVYFKNLKYGVTVYFAVPGAHGEVTDQIQELVDPSADEYSFETAATYRRKVAPKKRVRAASH